MQKKQTVTGICLLLIAAFLWASVNVILKYLAGRALNPIMVSCTLYCASLVFFVPISFLLWLRSGKTASSYWEFRRPNLIVGVAKAVETLSFIGAVVFISATRATLLTKLNSVWTYLILVIFYKRKVHAVSALGTILSVTGVFILLNGWEGLGNLDANLISGSSLAILSGLAFAVFSVALKRDSAARQAKDVSEHMRFTATFLGVAFLIMLPFGIVFRSTSLPCLSDFLWLFLAGLFLGMTYFLYYKALLHVTSLLAVIMLSFIIVFTLLLEQSFLDVSVLSISFAIGAIFIILGIIFIIKDENQKEMVEKSNTHITIFRK